MQAQQICEKKWSDGLENMEGGKNLIDEWYVVLTR